MAAGEFRAGSFGTGDLGGSQFTGLRGTKTRVNLWDVVVKTQTLDFKVFRLSSGTEAC